MTTESDGSWTVFGVPEVLWHAQLSNFLWDQVRPLTLRDRLAEFLVDVVEGKRPHLLLTGSPGVGKSHLSVAVYRQGVERFGTRLSTYVHVPSFCDRVKRGYGSGLDPFEEYEDASRLVVLDDLFGRDLSQHEASAIVYRLIDTAYQNGAAVLLNMNQDLPELSSRLPGHEVSRILANAKVVKMSADRDFRRGGG